MRCVILSLVVLVKNTQSDPCPDQDECGYHIKKGSQFHGIDHYEYQLTCTVSEKTTMSTPFKRTMIKLPNWHHPNNISVATTFLQILLSVANRYAGADIYTYTVRNIGVYMHIPKPGAEHCRAQSVGGCLTHRPCYCNRYTPCLQPPSLSTTTGL